MPPPEQRRGASSSATEGYRGLGFGDTMQQPQHPDDSLAPPPLQGRGSHSHGRRDSSSQVDESALLSRRVGPDGADGPDGAGGPADAEEAAAAAAEAAAAAAIATHHPVVLVRLPMRRPRPRVWTQEEEARLTGVCREHWPRVDWPAVAAELGRSVEDCVSRSTLLHLQELERTSRVPSPTKVASPPQPQPQQQGGQAPPSPLSASSAAASVAVGAGRRPSAPSSSAGAAAPAPANPSNTRGGGLLASEVAALARRHGFAWEAVGAALQADPWECWKLYEETHQAHEPHHRPPFISGGLGPGSSQQQGQQLFHSALDSGSDEEGGGAEGSHPYPFLSSGIGRSTSADDVAAFLPPSAPASRRSTRQGPGSPTLLVPTKGASSGSDAGSPPPPPSDWGGGRGGGLTPSAAASYLHQFPRPAAAHHHHHQQQQQQHGGGGGRAASPTLAPFARPPSAGELGGLQDSLAQGSIAGMQQSGLFLPGQDSLSLSVLESALLDMPSLYLGRSSLAAPGGSGGAASGGGSALGFGLGSHHHPHHPLHQLGGPLSSSVILGTGSGGTTLSPTDAGVHHRVAPPFFLPLPPRGAGYTTRDIPDTIEEGEGVAGDGAS